MGGGGRNTTYEYHFPLLLSLFSSFSFIVSATPVSPSYFPSLSFIPQLFAVSLCSASRRRLYVLLTAPLNNS